MNTTTSSVGTQTGGMAAFVVAMVIGFGIISVAGHVQAETLHDAAHDVRHATGFPCH